MVAQATEDGLLTRSVDCPDYFDDVHCPNENETAEGLPSVATKRGFLRGHGQAGRAVKGGRQALREPMLILISIVAFCSIYSNWHPIGTVPTIDFYQFWVVGHEAAAGQAGNIYSGLEREQIGRRYLNQAQTAGDQARLRTVDQRSVVGTFSTPSPYTAFGSMSSSDYERDLSRYRTLGLVFVALVAVMMWALVMLELGDLCDRAVILCAATAVLFGRGLCELLALRGASSDRPNEA